MRLPDIDLARLRAATRRREIQLRQASVNFTTFVETVSRDNVGQPIVVAPHQMMWHQHIEWCWSRGLFAGIMAPRSSGKTTSLIAPLASFLLGRDPNQRLKIISNDDRTAMKRVGETARVLRSPIYRRVFPAVFKGGAWTKHELYVNRSGSSPEPSLEARGVMSTGVGGRADAALFDDVVDQRNSADPLQRRKVIDLVQETWILSLDQGAEGKTAHALWISTPWSQGDCSFDLMAKPGWCFLIQRVSQDLTCIEQEVVGGGDFAKDYPNLVRVK